MRVVSRILAAALVVGATAAAVQAVNQNILGDTFQLKNPSTADKRKVLGKGKEKGSTNTIVGDPTVSGATLRVSAGGGTPSSQTFSLPQGISPSSGKPYWSGNVVKGFKYKDSKFENGTAIKAAQIKKTGGGVFSIKVLGNSKVNAITVLPPNLGTNGCLLLTIGGGDSYSVAFPPATGVIKNKGPLEYKHKKPGVEASCTTTTTTSTTTTTIPACAPNCPVNNGCFANNQCITNFCSGGLCKCPAQNFVPGITAFVSATLRYWPGGTQNFGTATCGGVLNNPSGNISDLAGDTWGIASKNGFGSCSVSGNVPTCNTVGATSSVQGNGRPYCSNSSDVFNSGNSTATVNVSCLP